MEGESVDDGGRGDMKEKKDTSEIARRSGWRGKVRKSSRRGT